MKPASRLLWYVLGLVSLMGVTLQAMTVRTSTPQVDSFHADYAGNAQVRVRTDWALDDYAHAALSWYSLYNSAGSQVAVLSLDINGNVSCTGSAVLTGFDKPASVGSAYAEVLWTVALPAGDYQVRHTSYTYQENNYAGGYGEMTTTVASITPPPAPPPPPPPSSPTGSLTVDVSAWGEFGGSSLLTWATQNCSTATVTYAYSGPSGGQLTTWVNQNAIPNGSLTVNLPPNPSYTDDAEHLFALTGQNASGTAIAAEPGKALTVKIVVKKKWKEEQAILNLSAASPQYVGSTQTLTATGGSGTGGVTITLTDTGGGVGSLSGSNLTALAVGTVKAKARKEGDTRYNPKESSEVTIQFVNPPADPNPTAALSHNAAQPPAKMASSGGTLTLSWSHNYATSATLAGQGFTGAEDVTAATAGSRVVTLPANTTSSDVTYTWTLTAAKSGKPTATATTSVVSGASALPAPTATITATPTSGVGSASAPFSTTIAWSATNVQDATLSVVGTGLSSTALTGSQAVSLTTAGSYLYTLTATGLDGSAVRRTVVVSVTAAPTSGPLSLTLSPDTLPSTGGTVTVVWTNDGTVTQLGGPQAGASPSSYSDVAQNGSQTFTLPANGTTSDITYYFGVRGNGSDPGPIVKSVRVRGLTSSYGLIMGFVVENENSASGSSIGSLFHTNYTNAPPYGGGGTWTFVSPQSLVLFLRGYYGVSGDGINRDYELTKIVVSPASAASNWYPNADPAAPNYKVFGESAGGFGGSAMCYVGLNATNPSVTVTAYVKKRPNKTLIIKHIADLGIFGEEDVGLPTGGTYGASATSCSVPYPPDYSQCQPSAAYDQYYEQSGPIMETDENGTRVAAVNASYQYNLSTLEPGKTRTLIYRYKKKVKVQVASPSQPATVTLGDMAVNFRDSSASSFFQVGQAVPLTATWEDVEYWCDECSEYHTDLGSNYVFKAWLIDGSAAVVPQTNGTTYTIPNKTFTNVRLLAGTSGDGLLTVGMFITPQKTNLESWAYTAYGPFHATLADYPNGESHDGPEGIIRSFFDPAMQAAPMTVKFPPRPGYVVDPGSVRLDNAGGTPYTGGTWNAATNTYTFTATTGRGVFSVSANYAKSVDFTIADVVHTYDRSVKQATVTPSDPTCREGVDFAVRYDGGAAPSQVKRVGGAAGGVGDYAITIEMLNSRFAVGTVTGPNSFRINPRPLSFDFSGGPIFAWDNSAKTIAITPSGILTGDSWAKGDNWDATAATATNAGDYNAQAFGQGNYTGNGSYQWQITPKAITFTFSPTQFTFAHDASGQPLLQGPTVTPSDPAATWLPDLDGTWQAAEARSYSFRVRGTGNYSGSAVCHWNIAPQAVHFTVSDLSHTYDGSAKFATIVPGDPWATYNVVYLPNAPTTDFAHQASGSYTVRIVASGNYAGLAEAVLEIRMAAPLVPTLSPAEGNVVVSDPQSPAYGRTYRRSWAEGAQWCAYLGRPGVRFVLTTAAAGAITRCELQGRWGAEPWATLALEAPATEGASGGFAHTFSVRLGDVVPGRPQVPLSYAEGQPQVGAWAFRARVGDDQGVWSAWSDEATVAVTLPLASVTETLRTVPPAGGLGAWFEASSGRTFSLPIWLP